MRGNSLDERCLRPTHCMGDGQFYEADQQRERRAAAAIPLGFELRLHFVASLVPEPGARDAWLLLGG